MKNDPIVQQVRDTKDQLAAAFDYDVARIFADLRSRETRWRSLERSQDKSEQADAPKRRIGRFWDGHYFPATG